MTKRTVLLGLAVVAGGAAASHVLGSRPDAQYGDSPLEPCSTHPNCALLRVPLAAGAGRVERAAMVAVQSDLPWWTGRLDSVESTPGGLKADFVVGPFQDRLTLAVMPEGDGSVVWIRSAALVGRSDLGVNRARVRRLVDAIRAELV